VDIRFHAFLLSAVAGLALATVPVGAAHAQTATDAVGTSAQSPEVVQPEVARRTVKPPAIAAQNLEGGLFYGSLNIQDLGRTSIWGSRLAYHINEDYFLEGTIGLGRANAPAYERVDGVLEPLSAQERDFSYGDLAIGWNALPGEVFLGPKRALPFAWYVTLGAGDAHFDGTNHFAVALGTGLRVLASDWVALHLDVRDLIFDSDILDHAKRTQNLQLSVAVTAFF